MKGSNKLIVFLLLSLIHKELSTLLGVPKLSSGTGLATATAAVMEILVDWELTDKIIAMGFDTTLSNTVSALGACTLLQ